MQFGIELEQPRRSCSSRCARRSRPCSCRCRRTGPSSACRRRRSRTRRSGSTSPGSGVLANWLPFSSEYSAGLKITSARSGLESARERLDERGCTLFHHVPLQTRAVHVRCGCVAGCGGRPRRSAARRRTAAAPTAPSRPEQVPTASPGCGQVRGAGHGRPREVSCRRYARTPATASPPQRWAPARAAIARRSRSTGPAVPRRAGAKQRRRSALTEQHRFAEPRVHDSPDRDRVPRWSARGWMLPSIDAGVRFARRSRTDRSHATPPEHQAQGTRHSTVRRDVIGAQRRCFLRAAAPKCMSAPFPRASRAAGSGRLPEW